MSKHRLDEDGLAVLPETVEQLAATERASHRRMPRYAVAVTAAVVVLVAGAAWVLTRPADPVSMFTPATTISARSNQVIEGFGEAPSRPSLSPRPSARVSSGKTPEAVALVPALAPAVAHYQFNEAGGATAPDASGHGRTATLDGGAAFGPGRLGNGVDLGGSSQYVALPEGILSGATDFTVSAWVRPDSVTTWSRVFDFGSGTGVNMFLTVRSGAGTARFAITNGGNGGEQRINAPAPLQAGVWTHVAVTMSGGLGILYLNRAEVARTTGMTLTPASLGTTTNNWIGRSQYQADPYLDGIVDDMRIYSRALSADEIAALP